MKWTDLLKITLKNDLILLNLQSLEKGCYTIIEPSCDFISKRLICRFLWFWISLLRPIKYTVTVRFPTFLHRQYSSSECVQTQCHESPSMASNGGFWKLWAWARPKVLVKTQRPFNQRPYEAAHSHMVSCPALHLDHIMYSNDVHKKYYNNFIKKWFLW